MNTEIKLPSDDELAALWAEQNEDYGLNPQVMTRIFRLARAAVEADRQQRGEPVGWLRNERGEATGASTLDPLFLLGASMPTGYVASYSPVYPQPATPVIKESLTVAEPAQEVIEAYDAIDNFLRNNLYDDDYA
ncbi:MAG: hypothetical protein WC284_16425, partial [Candidimonas sp.]